MDRVEKEEWIDRLLVFMNDEIEKQGCGVDFMNFNFSEDQEDFQNFSRIHEIEFSDFVAVLNICKSRGYIAKRIVSHGDLNDLNLSGRGQGRAISIVNQDGTPMETGRNVSIGSINVNGPTQIGNYNIQDIESFFMNLVEKIEQSSASDQEKEEVKSRLKNFLEHPITNTILGASMGAFLGG